MLQEEKERLFWEIMAENKIKIRWFEKWQGKKGDRGCNKKL